jgi:predicted acylesterase/phospholipase RssA
MSEINKVLIARVSKKILPVFVLVPGLIITTIILTSGTFKSRQNSVSVERNGVAVIITGAAARIPQEAALLEELDKRGLLKNLVFISGVSSGALNSVCLNGILDGKMTWAEYKTILFNLKNSDIFTQEGKRLPVNTAPSRGLFKRVVEDKLGYSSIGKLPVTTSISFTHLRDLDLKKDVYRMCSRNINEETDTSLNLVDIMLASSSFPIAFPPTRIRNVKTIPDVEYIDGGVGDDHIPFHALLEFEKYRGVGVDKIYIISRKSDSIPDISEELRVLGINDKGLFDRMGISLDAILHRGFIKRLEAFAIDAPELMHHTYVWAPEFKANFMLFNFENLQEQYSLTSQWAKTHEPLPLEDYLLKHMEKGD